MIAGEREVAAHNAATATAIDEGDASLPLRARKHGERVDRGQAQIGCKAKRSAMWQQEAITRRKVRRVGYALYGQPALTRDHGIAFDAVVLSEPDGQFATHIEATGDIAARFQQRQHIGQRIHRALRTIAKIIRTL